MFARSLRRSLRAPAPFVARVSARPAWGLRFLSNDLPEGSPALTYSSEKPVVKYTEEHEWIALHKDNVAFIGITKYAADALGDATFIEIVEPGEEVDAHDSIGSVESVKSASDLYTPVPGEIVEANAEVVANPAIVNSDPLGAGWFAKLKVTDPAAFDSLMDGAAYEEFIKSDD